MMTFVLSGILLFSSCEKSNEHSDTAYNPNKPIVLKSFYPTEGGARDKILLDGENFGTDASKIKVYFNKARATVISSSGNRIYAIVPRLPGVDPKISIVVNADSMVYDNSYVYNTQALVSTVTGNGTKSFTPGGLSEATVYGKYLELDREGNIFMSWRDGNTTGNSATTFGVARINESENIVTPLIQSVATGRILYANGLTVDRATGVLTAAHESVQEVMFTFDPKEAWYPRQRNAKYSASDYASIVVADRYKNFITFSPWDGNLYTRFRDGKIARINPQTFEATIIHQGPYGSQYGQAINPAKPWELYITLHSNANPIEFRQGIMVLDLRNPNGTGGFKRLNAPGGSSFKDGPIQDALFNLPKDIKFDNDGNMFVADYGNHCIRMISPDGVVTTVAGQPGTSGFKDGGPTESLFNQPWGVAVNELGHIYIADWSNARIRKLVIE